MCGIGPSHIRRLCDNPWDGGFGYDPITVGNFTLDMIFMLLADKKFLRSVANERTIAMSAEEAGVLVKDGMAAGRADDGTPIRAKIVGKSLARTLTEKYQAEREEAERKKGEELKEALRNQARLAKKAARAARVARRNARKSTG
jgi:hypothetical protein